MELAKVIAQKEALEKSKEQYKVVAQKNGVVHLNTPLTSGMVLQGGNLIGTITSKEEELIIETMLPSSDRPRIHIGNEVSLAIGGLLQSEYGTIPGNVPPAIIAAGMGISGGVADPLCINGNCRIQNIHERSKSRSTETIPDPAGSKLLMADTFL